MVDQDELHPVRVPPQPLHDPVDAVAGQAEDRVDPPVGQPLDQQLGCDLRHMGLLQGWHRFVPGMVQLVVCPGPSKQPCPGLSYCR